METIQEKLERVKKHEPYWHPHKIECDQFQRELEEQFFREATFQGWFQKHGIVFTYGRYEEEYYPLREHQSHQDRSKCTTSLSFKLNAEGFHIKYYREVARNARELLTITEFALQLEKDVQKTMYTFYLGPRRFDLHYYQEIEVLLRTTILREEQFGEAATTLSAIDTKITECLNEARSAKKHTEIV